MTEVTAVKKKIISAMLITAFLISAVCGCSHKEDTANKNDGESIPAAESETTAQESEDDNIDIDAAVAVADAFASAAVGCDLTSMGEVCDGGFSAMWDEWGYYLSFDDADTDLTEDRCNALRAVRDTLSYTIDEDSASELNGQVYVDVTFFIADYGTAFDNTASGTTDDFIAELEAVDMIELATEICIREERDELVCCNYRRILNMLYEFTLENPHFDHPIQEYTTGEIHWYIGEVGSDGVRRSENTTHLMARLQFEEDYGYGYDGLRCEVTCNGDVVYTFYDTNTCDLYCGQIDPEHATEMGFLIPAGEYIFTFYDENDNVLASESCVVTTSGPVPSLRVEWWGDNADVLENSTLYDMDDILVTLSVYNVFVNGIDYKVEISYNGEVFYEEERSGEAEVLIRATSDPYFPTDDSNTYFAPGEYTVTFFDADGTVLATDTRTFEVS